MSLNKESRRLTKRLYANDLPDWLVDELKKGRRFIPVPKEVDINADSLPEELILQNINFPTGDFYRAVIPRRVMMYVGDKENPEELLDVYQEILSYEKGLMEGRKTDVSVSFFAQQVRDSYEVGMINNLLNDEGKTAQADFKKEIVERYEGKENVSRTVQQIAKTYSGLQQLEKYKPQDVLKHVTEEIDIEVSKKVKCYKGSHWEWEVVKTTMPVQVTREKVEAIGTLEENVLSSIYPDTPITQAERIRRTNELRSYVNMKYLAKSGNLIPLITSKEEISKPERKSTKKSED
jgi:hypothetical protein